MLKESSGRSFAHAGAGRAGHFYIEVVRSSEDVGFWPAYHGLNFGASDKNSSSNDIRRRLSLAWGFGY
jgi:hypothetical protein